MGACTFAPRRPGLELDGGGNLAQLKWRIGERTAAAPHKVEAVDVVEQGQLLQRLPQQFLYFLPLPQGQGWLRPTLAASRRTGWLGFLPEV